ncbi:MAG: Rrf2 family transcriptional regulator [Chloroflexi bacterium]|nr:Rrf2 family transcriptional regulator [Chloroflexota bacterium]
MLRISTKGEYGSRLMVYLARRWGQGPVALAEVAANEQLPVEYLEQLAVLLRRSGLIESFRGVRGGYTLARPPEEVHMGEVVRALEGPIAPMVCVNEGHNEMLCAFEAHCSTRLMWLRVGKAIAQALDEMTLAQLIPQPENWEPVPFYEHGSIEEHPWLSASVEEVKGRIQSHG